MNTRNTNRELISLLLKTKSLEQAEIATLVGCSSSLVAKVAGELDLQTRKNTQYLILSDEQWQKLLNEVENNMLTITEASKKYGVSRPAIYARRASQ